MKIGTVNNVIAKREATSIRAFPITREINASTLLNAKCRICGQNNWRREVVLLSGIKCRPLPFH